MSALVVLLTVIGYFALLFLISWYSSRKADNEAFFTGNRSTPWYVASIAMVGAAISGVTFCSVPGMVAAKGYSYLQMVLGFAVGFFVIAFILVPMFYRRNLISIYGYLEQRFGGGTYRTGAWFFFISKMLGAAVRFFVVCLVLQLSMFEPFGIPFEINVLISAAMVWLYTKQGGVKAVVWTDILKTICLVGSVILCTLCIASQMNLGFGELMGKVVEHKTSQVFYFEDIKAGEHFLKQFVAGIFMVIATTGLDQDMMQRTMACKNFKESQKNMMVSGIMQIFIVALFLVLGTVLYMYAEVNPAITQEVSKPDELFGAIANSEAMPLIVGIMFTIGLVAAAYSAAGSALTSLTTSFTVDILEANKKQDDKQLTRTRTLVHIGMAVLMALVIIVFYYLNNDDAISAVYKIASYTYGPILGLFVFGMFTKFSVRDKLVPIACIVAPLASYFIQDWLKSAFDYTMSFELLLLNALLTCLGLCCMIKGKITE